MKKKLVRFIGTTVSNATGKEGTGSPCHDVATEIHKIFSVDTSNQILIECEVLHFLPKSILAKLRNRRYWLIALTVLQNVEKKIKISRL